MRILWKKDMLNACILYLCLNGNHCRDDTSLCQHGRPNSHRTPRSRQSLKWSLTLHNKSTVSERYNAHFIFQSSRQFFEASSFENNSSFRVHENAHFWMIWGIRLNFVTSQHHKVLAQIKAVEKAKSGITAFCIFFEKPKSKEEYFYLAFLLPLHTETQCGNKGRKEGFYPVSCY